MEENTSTLCVETYEDVDYVEGCWRTDKHQELVEEGQDEITGRLLSKELAIVKLGAVANDNYVRGMTMQPQWHGYWKNVGTLEKSNYVANYLYISNIAKQYKCGNSSTYPMQTGMDPVMERIIEPFGIRIVDSDPDKKTLTDKGIISWEQALNGEPATMKNKSLFLYGMALHCATDTFAHSTTRLNGFVIKHDDDKASHKNVADDDTYYTNRIKCAREIAGNVLSNYLLTSSGKVSDFYIKKYDRTFHLVNIAEYMSIVDNTYYKNKKSYFDALNYSINP